MAVLSKPFDVGIKEGVEVRVKMAAVKIYQGGAVGVVSGVGYATPLLVATSGIAFIGIAEETVDNSTGSAGDKWIRVRRRGLIGFNSSGLTVANIGDAVYFVSGSDDNTVSTTASAVFAGYLAALDSNDIAWVAIDGAVRAYGTAEASAVTYAEVLSGGTFQGTREESATQNYPLGTLRAYPDGRKFRYVKARTALEPEFGAGYAAKTIANAVAPVQGTGVGVIGAYTVKVTVGATDGLAGNGAIAANELVGGFIVIGNGTSQHPMNRRITANTVVAAGGGTTTVTVDEALEQNVTAGATNLETLMNPWILSDMYVTNSAYVTARGMPARRMTISYFGWVQTAGPCWITSDGNTCDSAGDRQVYFAANGSVVSGNDVTGDINVQQLAGHAIDMSGSGASNAPFVNLCLEVS